MENIFYIVAVRVDRQWLQVTDIEPVTLQPSKMAYKFPTNEDAQEYAAIFNEAIVIASTQNEDRQ